MISHQRELSAGWQRRGDGVGDGVAQGDVLDREATLAFDRAAKPSPPTANTDSASTQKKKR